MKFCVCVLKCGSVRCGGGAGIARGIGGKATPGGPSPTDSYEGSGERHAPRRRTEEGVYPATPLDAEFAAVGGTGEGSEGEAAAGRMQSREGDGGAESSRDEAPEAISGARGVHPLPVVGDHAPPPSEIRVTAATASAAGSGMAEKDVSATATTEPATGGDNVGEMARGEADPSAWGATRRLPTRAAAQGVHRAVAAVMGQRNAPTTGDRRIAAVAAAKEDFTTPSAATLTTEVPNLVAATGGREVGEGGDGGREDFISFFFSALFPLFSSADALRIGLKRTLRAY